MDNKYDMHFDFVYGYRYKTNHSNNDILPSLVIISATTPTKILIDGSYWESATVAL